MASFEVIKNNGEIIDGEKHYRINATLPDEMSVADHTIDVHLRLQKELGKIKDYKVTGHIEPFYDEVIPWTKDLKWTYFRMDF